MKSYTRTGTIDGYDARVTAKLDDREDMFLVTIFIESLITHRGRRFRVGTAASPHAASRLFGIACATVDDIVKGE